MDYLNKNKYIFDAAYHFKESSVNKFNLFVDYS